MSRINRHFLSLGLNGFPVCNNLFIPLFQVTPFIQEAVQSYMLWIPVKKGIYHFRSKGWEVFRKMAALPIRILETLYKKPYLASPGISWKTPNSKVQNHLSINILAEKMTLFPITEKFRTRTFSNQLISYFHQLFGWKKTVFFNFPFPITSKQKLFSNQ